MEKEKRLYQEYMDIYYNLINLQRSIFLPTPIANINLITNAQITTVEKILRLFNNGPRDEAFIQRIEVYLIWLKYCVAHSTRLTDAVLA